MTSAITSLATTRPTCHGLGLVVSGLGSMASSGADVRLALASLLGEREAGGEGVESVTVRLSDRADCEWAQDALSWLFAHGRRVLLRTPVVLSRGLISLARSCSATVVLELGHHTHDIQAALLGEAADPAAALLLQAQHLRSIGVPVAIHLGPLLVGIHDDAAIVTLLRHIKAADVHHVHPAVGVLGTGRLRALERVLPTPQLATVLHAFGLGFDVLVRAKSNDSWRLPASTGHALHQQARRLAIDHGLSVDACGCWAQCRLDSGRRPDYTAVLEPELFASSASPDRLGMHGS